MENLKAAWPSALGYSRHPELLARVKTQFRFAL